MNDPPESSGEDAVVRAVGLQKFYGSVEALKGLNLEIQRGEIFGLIGPDGAGKTTAFHIMGGVLEPSAGQIGVLGQRPADARLKIGYLTQQFSLYPDLSVKENLRYVAGLRGVSKSEFLERQETYLKLMNLYRFKDRLASALSGGMKQKLALCAALLARPELLLLDEPTTGVDPVSRREFWDLLTTVAHEGVTIAVATPYLDEAERCNRVALMYEGSVYKLGTPDELKQSLGLIRLSVRAQSLDSLQKFLIEEAGEKLVADVQRFGDRLDVLVVDPTAAAKELQEAAQRLGQPPLKIDELEPTLENVFVKSLRTPGKEVLTSAKYKFLADETQKIPPHGAAIKASYISKVFGDFNAVKNVSLEVAFGEIYGLLGANGAGKTTTIKMLCGLLEATSGQMELAGAKANLRSTSVRQQIGYMSQKFTLYDDLSILENLQFYCGVYGVPSSLRSERINWVLKTTGLDKQQSMLTGKLPGGWKQRLSFGACVMHQPKILFLDEPTSGVDPVARRQLWQLIRDFAAHDTAILVTTHFLEEAEHCHRLGFMVDGQVVAQGSPSEIKSSQPGQLVELSVSSLHDASRILKQMLDSWRVSIFADRIHVVIDRPEELAKIESALEEHGVQVRSSRLLEFSLEDAFIGIVERASGASAA